MQAFLGQVSDLYALSSTCKVAFKSLRGKICVKTLDMSHTNSADMSLANSEVGLGRFKRLVPLHFRLFLDKSEGCIHRLVICVEQISKAVFDNSRVFLQHNVEIVLNREPRGMEYNLRFHEDNSLWEINEGNITNTTF